MRKQLIVCSVSLLTGAAACAGSQAEQVKDARMEQTDARADATETSVERAAESREAATERAYDAIEQNIAAAKPPGESATQELAEVSKDRTLYQ